MTAGLVIEVVNDRQRDDAFVIKVPPEDFIPTTILERLSNIGDSGFKSESDEALKAESMVAALWSAASGDAANAPLVTFTRTFEDADGKPAEPASTNPVPATPATATAQAASKPAPATPNSKKAKS